MTDAEFTAQRELAAALAAAILETDGVAKRGKNEQGRGYMYAKAEDVVREAERVLSMYGLAVAPGASKLTMYGTAAASGQGRPIFALEQEFIVMHTGGGVLRGSVTVGIGTNLDAGPAQAISSALTGAERDYYRCLLRMPRCDADDPDHPNNTRARERQATSGDPPPPASPRVPPPAPRKAAGVLAAIRGVRDVAGYEKCRDKWNDVLAERHKAGPDGKDTGDRGYSDADVGEIKAALEKAAERVGAA